MSNISLFAQIICLIPRNISDRLIESHKTDKHCKGIGTWEHLVSMLFCQFGQARSLRDICQGMRAAEGNLSHLGISQVCSRSNLSYLNKHRKWEFFRDLYSALATHYARQLGRHAGLPSWLEKKLYALDSSVVSLCLNSFDWARYRRHKGGIKLHSLLDVETALPEYVHLTEARKHDAPAARSVLIPSGSVVVADRGYLDMSLMAEWHKQDIRFVVRNKENVLWNVVEELSAELVSDSSATFRVETDQLVEPQLEKTRAKYPYRMRLVKIIDINEGNIELLTNQEPVTDAKTGKTSWTAAQVGELYRERWKIELFFRDIKQHLKVKSFVGTSENAVLIQIWTALITILLTRLLKAKADTKWCLANLIGFIRLHLFAKTDLDKWLLHPFDKAYEKKIAVNGQLEMFSP